MGDSSNFGIEMGKFTIQVMTKTCTVNCLKAMAWLIVDMAKYDKLSQVLKNV